MASLSPAASRVRALDQGRRQRLQLGHPLRQLGPVAAGEFGELGGHPGEIGDVGPGGGQVGDDAGAVLLQVRLELAAADHDRTQLVVDAGQRGVELLLLLGQPRLEALDPPLRRIGVGGDLLDQGVELLLVLAGEVELPAHLGDGALGVLGDRADRLDDQVLDPAVAGEAQDEQDGGDDPGIAHLERALDPVADILGQPALQQLQHFGRDVGRVRHGASPRGRAKRPPS